MEFVGYRQLPLMVVVGEYSHCRSMTDLVAQSEMPCVGTKQQGMALAKALFPHVYHKWDLPAASSCWGPRVGGGGMKMKIHLRSIHLIFSVFSLWHVWLAPLLSLPGISHANWADVCLEAVS